MNMKYLSKEVADRIYNASERTKNKYKDNNKSFQLFMNGYIEALRDCGLISNDQKRELIMQYGDR